MWSRFKLFYIYVTISIKLAELMKRTDWVYISYLLLAFLLPFGDAPLTWGITIAGICWLVSNNWKEKLYQIRSVRWFPFYVLFYLLCVVGAFYSIDKNEASFKLQQKVVIVILPMIFLSSPVQTMKLFQIIMNVFVVSCLILVVKDEILSLIRFNSENDFDTFFYERFTCNLHPTYLAFIFNMGVAYCLERIFELNKNKRLQLVFYYPVLLFLLIGVLQTSSKAGILSAGIVWLCLAVYQFRKKVYPGHGKVFPLAIIFILFISGVVILNREQRMSNMVNVIQKKDLLAEKTSGESSQLRLLIWHSAWNLIKQRPLTGYGTGDGNNMLKEENLKNGYTAAYERNLNAHSQYLQILLANGIPGLVALLAALLLMLYLSFIGNNYLGYCFILLILFNLLFESMLETRNGIAIFSFFSGLLFCFIGDRNKEEGV
jgi:O-antigen ligase